MSREILSEDNPLYLVMPPQPGLLAGFATGMLSIRRYIALHNPDQHVEIVDLSAMRLSEVSRALPKFSTSQFETFFIGLTTTTATYQSALAVARAAKACWGTRAVIILGGPHASSDAISILNRQAGIVDYVIVGEGERAVAAFLQAWPDVRNVPGLAWREHGRVNQNSAPSPLGTAELDALSLDDEWFNLTGHPGKFDAFTYVSARGCPLNCAFCSVANQAIRAKSPQTLALEVETIVRNGYRRIAIEDNFFAHSPRRTEDVCSAIEALLPRLPHFEWDCQTRVEAIARPGTSRRLAAAGCTAVYLGVEALAPDALRFLGKAVQVERYIDLVVQRALPALFDASLKANINIQFGLPHEAGEYLNVTIERLTEIGMIACIANTHVNIFPQLFVVYPGTEHFRRFVADGLLWPEVFEDFTAWERDEAELIYWMGRYFAHGIGGIPLGLLEPRALKRREFRIDPRPLLCIERRLDELDRSSGLRVFSYLNHLAPGAHRYQSHALEGTAS